MTRRMQGRGPVQAAVIVGAVALLATGCADPAPSALTYCATQPPPPAAAVVVDDSHCDRGEPGYGLIEYQVPADPDPDDDTDVSVIILGVGQSVPYDARHRTYSSGYRALPKGTSPRIGSAPARAVRPPAAATGRSSTITRGGLGVASSSSSGSSAAKGGSSGS